MARQQCERTARPGPSSLVQGPRRIAGNTTDQEQHIILKDVSHADINAKENVVFVHGYDMFEDVFAYESMGGATIERETYESAS